MESKVEDTEKSLTKLANQINKNLALSDDAKLAMLQTMQKDNDKFKDKKNSGSSSEKHKNTFFHLPEIKKQNSFSISFKPIASLTRSSSSSSGSSPSRSNSSSSASRINLNNPVNPNKFPLTSDVTKKYVTAYKNSKCPSILLYCEEDPRYEIFINSSGAFLVDATATGTLGEGASAKVCRAWDMNSEKLVAAKIYNTKVRGLDITKEINCLTTKNKFHAFFYLHNSPRIVLMNYTAGLNLLNVLYQVNGADEHGEPNYVNKTLLSPFVTLKCVYKLLEQVSDLHQTPVDKSVFSSGDFDGLLHRDIKAANVLVEITKNDDVTLHLIDYTDMIPNLKNGRNSNTCCGSNGYVPPEIIGDKDTRKPYTRESDFFQAGITIAEIITSAKYQSGLQKYIRENNGLTFNDNWTLEHHTKQIMQDVFINKKYVLKVNPSLLTIDQNIQEIVYKHIIFPVLCELVISMTDVDPASRLKKSSLKHEIKKLKEIELLCNNISKNIHTRVDNSIELHYLNQCLFKYQTVKPGHGSTSASGQVNDMESDINELIKNLIDLQEPLREPMYISSPRGV